MLAMHMANELLTRNVAGAFMALAAVLLALAARATQRRFDPARVPLMGVLGAFVFAAQMINFPIPVGGTSGHLGGGVLLAILLGPHAATLVMASILIVQCLIFQDGGILALGANVLNLGVVPCYLGYAVFRIAAGRAPSTLRLFVAVVSATLLGMAAGAAMVPVETRLSGVLAVPFSRFLLMMVGLHLLIGLFEAFITFAVIAYLARVRPALLEVQGTSLANSAGRLAPGAVLASVLVVALLLGGIGSLFASSLPDALDSLTGARPDRTMVHASPDPATGRATRLQEQTAPLPEYGLRGREEWWSTSLSGILGTLVTLGIVWAIGRRLRPATPHH